MLVRTLRFQLHPPSQPQKEGWGHENKERLENRNNFPFKQKITFFFFLKKTKQKTILASDTLEDRGFKFSMGKSPKPQPPTNLAVSSLLLALPE